MQRISQIVLRKTAIILHSFEPKKILEDIFDSN